MSFIKEQQEEALEQLDKNLDDLDTSKFHDSDDFKEAVLDECRKALSQVVQNTVEKIDKILEKAVGDAEIRDEYGGTGKETAKVIRIQVQSLLKDITNKDNLK